VTQQGQGSFSGTDSRRSLLLPALAGLAGCAAFRTKPVSALVSLVEPDAKAAQQFDLPRNKEEDEVMVKSLTGLTVRRLQAYTFPKTQKLLQQVLPTLPKKDAVVVEVGIGTFPNARFYQVDDGPDTFDTIGIDPNDFIEAPARTSADKYFMSSRGNSLRIKHGVAEALPLADKVADLVVCTQTLCNVEDVAKALAEIKRVLKPGGKFLFNENVLNEYTEDNSMAEYVFGELSQDDLQRYRTGRGNACRYRRRTGDMIQQAGFADVALEYYQVKNDIFFELVDGSFVCGIATA